MVCSIAAYFATPTIIYTTDLPLHVSRLVKANRCLLQWWLIACLHLSITPIKYSFLTLIFITSSSLGHHISHLLLSWALGEEAQNSLFYAHHKGIYYADTGHKTLKTQSISQLIFRLCIKSKFLIKEIVFTSFVVQEAQLLAKYAYSLID